MLHGALNIWSHTCYQSRKARAGHSRAEAGRVELSRFRDKRLESSGGDERAMRDHHVSTASCCGWWSDERWRCGLLFLLSLRQEVSAGWQVGVRAVQCVRGVCVGAQAVGCLLSLSSLSLWTEVQVDKNSGTAMAHTCGSCGGAVLSVASHLRAVGSTLRGGRGPLGPGLASGLPRGCLGGSLGAAWEWRRRCLFRGLKGRRVVTGPTHVS